MEVHGGAQRLVWRCVEVCAEVHGGLCGGEWRVCRGLQRCTEVHGGCT